jgi:hypothetical protein
MAKFIIEVDTTKEEPIASVKMNGVEIPNVYAASVYLYKDKEGELEAAQVEVSAMEVAGDVVSSTRYFSCSQERSNIGTEIEPGVFKVNEIELAKSDISKVFMQ